VNSKIEITFKGNSLETFDYLVISDGVFSSTKSTLFNKNIRPKYFGSVAIRGIAKKENLKFLNKNNIAIFLGPNIHLVVYPVSMENHFNLVVITRNKLDQNNLDNYSFFENKNNIKNFLEKSSIQINEDLKNLFNNVQDLKCFPIFISDKIQQPNQKNIFFLGDALFALPPTFAQGASQSTESAYELFKILGENSNNNFNKYYINRIKRIRMVNQRSKLNYFIFHLSNPILVLIRNKILRMVVNNKNFLNKYLGKIYLKI
jgi:salicylate hydroxylase